jgi:hypothetical protein
MGSLSATRRHRRTRGESDFLTLDEIALSSDALDGGSAPDAAATRAEAENSFAPRSADRLRLLRLQSAWGRAVGPHLKSVSRPCSYRASTLVVEVRDAAWKRELERARPEILSRLARLLPGHPLDHLSFRLESGMADRRSREAPGTGAAARAAPAGESLPFGADLTVELFPSLEKVASDALRHRLREVMGRYLARIS